MNPARRRWLLGAAALPLAACGGGGGGSESPPPAPPPSDLSLGVPGEAVVKVRATGLGLAMLTERLARFDADTQLAPARTLRLIGDGGQAGAVEAPAGWSLVDFEVHPSGQLTLLLAGPRALRLARGDAAGRVVNSVDLVDPAAADDPFIDFGGGVRDDTSLVPPLTRDAARLAALGEDVVLAARTGRLAVVAQRLGPVGTGFERRWRTLVEPGTSLFGRSLLGSGTYDPFGQLYNHWNVHTAVAPNGTVAVAVAHSLSSEYVALAHNEHFDERLVLGDGGALVTRLAADGRRLGTTAVNAVNIAETHGLRATDDRIAVVGRVRTQRLAEGWNAFCGFVSTSDGALLGYRPLDVERSDILFDLAPAGGGRWLAVGATGYTQNPAGASISEDCAPLAVLLDENGGIVRRVDFPRGTRHAELRSVGPWRASFVAGGMLNGPGTHSADGDLSLLVADGVVRSLQAG